MKSQTNILNNTIVYLKFQNITWLETFVTNKKLKKLFAHHNF